MNWKVRVLTTALLCIAIEWQGADVWCTVLDPITTPPGVTLESVGPEDLTIPKWFRVPESCETGTFDIADGLYCEEYQ